MADKPLTRKDLESVVQKVTIENKQSVKVENAKDIAKPIVEEQKKNDIKKMEKDIKQTALFEDIAIGMKAVSESISEGFSSLSESLKTKGLNILTKLGTMLGIAAGIILSPVIAAGAFFKQLGIELKYLKKISANLFKGQRFKPVINFFRRLRIFFSRKGPFGNIIKALTNATNTFKDFSKGFTADRLAKPLNAVKTGVDKVTTFFTRIGNFFMKNKAFTKGFNLAKGFIGNFGRILGKVFLPITILMGIFDFVKGFMSGYSEGGIIEGIKQGLIGVFDGLVGGLVRLLANILDFFLSAIGLDKLGEGLKQGVDSLLNGIYGVFGGLLDLVKGIFTLDLDIIGDAFKDIWNGIVDIIKGIFNPLTGLVGDIFDIGKGIGKFFSGGDKQKENDSNRSIRRSSRRRNLDRLDNANVAPVVIVSSSEGKGASMNNTNFAPTNIVMNDTDRSVKALQAAVTT